MQTPHPLGVGGLVLHEPFQSHTFPLWRGCFSQVRCSTLELVSIWTPPEGHHISVAHSNGLHILLGTAGPGSFLTLLKLVEEENLGLTQVSRVELDHEVACLSLARG